MLQKLTSTQTLFHNDSNAEAHSTELLKIGDDLLKSHENRENIFFKKNIFCCKVYPCINNNINKDDWLCGRVLHASKNHKILSIIFGEFTTYTSADCIME